MRVVIQDEITQDEHVQLRFQVLDALEVGRLHALQNLELYRQNVVRAYDKLIKKCVFQKVSWSSCQAAHRRDAQDEGQVRAKVGHTIFRRASL